MLLPFLCLRAASHMQSIADVVRQMTLEEKVSLCHGGSDFGTKAIPRLGVPEYRFSDGPNGVRDQEQIPTTGFPTGVSMAASWDPELIRSVGKGIAEEAKVLGKSVMLGPALNIDLTPLGGRTFEYESEDPFLNARICVPYIEGEQSQGILSCAKHYAANSFEMERGTVNDVIDERTLREIFLPSFEAAVKEAHVGSIMAAYNKINGAYCAENKHILTDILKSEWGFKGFVMSDWGAVHSTVPTALNGLDLEMPGEKDNYLGIPLLKAVQEGQVPQSQLDEMVTRTLTALQGHDFQDLASGMTKDQTVSTPEHRRLAIELAENAMVLLKNDRGILPLDKSQIHSVAVIGPNSNVEFSDSGGSGSVIVPFEVTPLAGLKQYLGSRVDVRYAPGQVPAPNRDDEIRGDALTTESGDPGLIGEYFANSDFKGAPSFTRTDPSVYFSWDVHSPAPNFPRENFSVRWTGYLTAPETTNYVISSASDDGSRIYLDGKMIIDNWGPHGVQTVSATVPLVKGERHRIRVDFFQLGYGADMRLTWVKLPPGPKPWIAQAAEAAANSDAAILFVGANHDLDTEGADKPNIALPGDQDELVEAVLAANPRTVVVLINGTPLAMPWISQSHAVLEAWYPGMMGGNAIPRVLFGEVNPSGKLPITFPNRLEDSPSHALGDYPPKNGDFHYDEKLLVGYRWYDTKRIEPLFPFGYGLSYTTFKLSNAAIQRGENQATLSLDVENTGSRPGAQVVQVYVHEEKPAVDRPEKELKGFQKVYLQPGETRRVSIHLNPRAFAYYSVQDRDWKIDRGMFDILIGNSSRNIAAHLKIAMAGERLPESSAP